MWQDRPGHIRRGDNRWSLTFPDAFACFYSPPIPVNITSPAVCLAGGGLSSYGGGLFFTIPARNGSAALANLHGMAGPHVEAGLSVIKSMYKEKLLSPLAKTRVGGTTGCTIELSEIWLLCTFRNFPN